MLRSPPFPWIDRAIAAVSVAGTTPLTDAEADALIEAIRAARVGGDFWAADVDLWSARGDAGTLRCAENDERACLAWLAGIVVLRADGTAVAAADLRVCTVERLRSARYRDPFTGAAVTPLAAVARLGEWRRLLDANRKIGAVAGIARWKRPQLRRFLWDGTRYPAFRAERAAVTRAAHEGRAVAAWPSRVTAMLPVSATAAGIATTRLEDGFIRSQGLGSDLHPPWSIVVDAAGIYYDPASASALETLLATHPFPPDLLHRAAGLREAIVAGGVSKYGTDTTTDAALPSGRRIVVAIGQVEDDLSVRLGGTGLDNAGFLSRVRADEPDAFIVYRPHPDVLAGHRRGDVPADLLARLADRVDAGGTLLALIERADSVHVLSSLTGFEALLRGRAVTVHGQPFYAGWGLTRDLAPPLARRGRRLDLDALVAATLILYPRYLDPVTRLPCPPEVLVARFAALAERRAAPLVRLRRLQGRLRRWFVRAKTGA